MTDRRGPCQVGAGVPRLGQDGPVDEDDQRWRDPHPRQVPIAPDSVSAADRARKMGRGLKSGTLATGRGLRSLGRGTARASRYTVDQAKRASEAEGAGES